jgi:VanZ family protein
LSLLPILTLLYVALIVYGSLFPFEGWDAPERAFLKFLSDPWPQDFSRSDLITNVLVYIPLGLLLAGWILRSLNGPSALILASVSGGLLSIAMEGLQAFFPGRVSSKLDVIANIGGAIVGALLAWLISPRTLPGAWIKGLRREWLLPGRLISISLVALLLGVMTQLALVLPPQGPVRWNLSMPPLWDALFDSSQLDLLAVGLYAGRAFGLGLFATLLLRPRKPTWWIYLMVIGGALLARLFGSMVFLKALPAGWQLPAEATTGLAVGIALLWLLSRLNATSRTALAGIAILGSYIAGALMPGSASGATEANPFNWIPFHDQMDGLAGLLDILAGIAPFLVLGCLINLATPLYRQPDVPATGTVLVIALVSGLEWAQHFIPGRSPDITDILVVLGSWLIPWRWRPEIISPLSSPDERSKATPMTTGRKNCRVSASAAPVPSVHDGSTRRIG